jgi:hypothetical protein
VSGNAQILVCEKGNKWSIAFRRVLGPAFPLVETRSLAQCRQRWHTSPPGFVALELTADNAEAVLGHLLEFSRRWGHARAMVLAGPGWESQECVFREAGATHVLFSTRELGTVERLVQRQRQLRHGPNLGFREFVWRSLPWTGDLPGKKASELENSTTVGG